VLETEKRKEEKDCKWLGCVQPKSSSVWHTGLSGGAPDSVRCATLASGEQDALGKVWQRTTIIHRTVRWANGRQRNGRPRNPRATRGPRQRSAGGTGLSGVHRTVSGAPTATALQRSSAQEKEIDPHRIVYSDCPVCHPTEGNFGLPCWPPTAPSCLGAIKGTHRRMEESLQAFKKHSKPPRLQLHAFDSLR
jgi:hypothetical protein